MKKTTIALAILLATSTSITFAQVKHDGTHKTVRHTKGAKKYSCPMHPEVVMNKPGTCPKCNMDLVPMKMKASKTRKPMTEMKN